MKPKIKSSYRLLPRLEPTPENFEAIFADAWKAIRKGRVTNSDLRAFEKKYFEFRRIK